MTIIEQHPPTSVVSSSASSAGNSLTVPLVIWGDHEIKKARFTQIHCLPDNCTVVAGTAEGHILQFAVDEERLEWIQLRMVLLGHSQAVSCLASTSSGAMEETGSKPSKKRKNNFISCSEDGSACIWDADEGTVVNSVQSSFIHRKIFPYVHRTTKSELLFCVGDYADIVVLDPFDLSTLAYVSSQIDPCWMSSLVFTQDSLIGATISGGALKFWPLSSFDKIGSQMMFYEDKTSSINAFNVRAMAYSYLNPGILLVISSNSWQIIDVYSGTQLILSECVIEPIDGVVVDIDRIAIGFVDSTFVIFQLPRSKLSGTMVLEKFGPSPQNIANTDQPFVFALLKGIPNAISQPIFDRVNFCFSPILSLATLPRTESKNNMVFRIDSDNNLSVWQIPKNFDILINEFIRNRRPIVYDPTIKLSVADVWEKDAPWKNSFFETEANVTTVVYVGFQNKLVFGFDNGTLRLIDASFFIAGSFTSTKNIDSDPTEYVNIIENVHRGAVSCLLYPFQQNPRYEPNIVISGGADHLIAVINTTKGECVHRFCCQSGPILGLSIPPPNCNPRILQSVCAIAEDNSFALYNLREYKCIFFANRQLTPIRAVKWRPFEDFLLLGCEDGAVYVWQLDSKCLDRILHGQTALDVLEACAEHGESGSGYAPGNPPGATDEAGASQAVQLIRAIRHKNIAAVNLVDNFCCPSCAPQNDALMVMEHNNCTTERVASEIRKIAGVGEGVHQEQGHAENVFTLLPPINIIHLKTISDRAFLILFNIDTIIRGLTYLNQKFSPPTHIHHTHQEHEVLNGGGSFLGKKPVGPPGGIQFTQSATDFLQQSEVGSDHQSLSSEGQEKAMVTGLADTFCYLEMARIAVALLHAWSADKQLDDVCLRVLHLFRPEIPLCYGAITKHCYISLYVLHHTGTLPANKNCASYLSFAANVRWRENRFINTFHLLSIVALSNTLMSLHSTLLHLSSIPFISSNNEKGASLKRKLNRRLSSRIPTSATDENTIQSENEAHQIKQAWSSLAALHCVILPDLLRATKYAPPRLDIIAKRWQDGSVEIRDAAQALLVRELGRLDSEGRLRIIRLWTKLLPTQVEPELSIFEKWRENAIVPLANKENKPQQALPSRPPPPVLPAQKQSGGGAAPPPIPPRGAHPGVIPTLPNSVPISPSMEGIAAAAANNETTTLPHKNNVVKKLERTEEEKVSVVTTLEVVEEQLPQKIEGIGQLRRNQVIAIIVLGVIGSEFSAELSPHLDICRETALSLVELFMAEEGKAGSDLLPPPHSPFRRAAIDLFGRGFNVWQPHVDFTRVLLKLLELASVSELLSVATSAPPSSEFLETCRVAKHALALIATAQPSALINGLSMEVARFNAVSQHHHHQTTTHPSALNSPLMKCRIEVLKLLELITDKHNSIVSDSILQVGEVLIHCVDPILLKQRSLSDIFPPISKFCMVAYCPTSKRIAVGGKNGSIVVHELRTMKAQTIQAHKSPVTALAFSQDGKCLASYSAKDACLSFWQTQQSFLGMGQNVVRFLKSLPAPSEFPVISPGGSYQPFRARLVWINAKSLTLMLPNGKENRFTI